MPLRAVGAPAPSFELEEDQSGGRLRIGRREEGCHLTALSSAEYESALGTRPLEHRPHVVHARLQTCPAGSSAVGEAGAALVEHDQPKRPRQALVELPVVRRLPVIDAIGDEVGDEDEIALGRAHQLVRDRDTVVAGVADVGLHGTSFLDFGRRDNGDRAEPGDPAAARPEGRP